MSVVSLPRPMLEAEELKEVIDRSGLTVTATEDVAMLPASSVADTSIR